MTDWARPKPLPREPVVCARVCVRNKSGKLNPASARLPTVKSSRRDGVSQSRPDLVSSESIGLLEHETLAIATDETRRVPDLETVSFLCGIELRFCPVGTESEFYPTL